MIWANCLFFLQHVFSFQKMWRQSAHHSHSLRWEWKTAHWQFQTKLLHYFLMSKYKSNLHFTSGCIGNNTIFSNFVFNMIMNFALDWSWVSQNGYELTHTRHRYKKQQALLSAGGSRYYQVLHWVGRCCLGVMCECNNSLSRINNLQWLTLESTCRALKRKREGEKGNLNEREEWRDTCKLEYTVQALWKRKS